MTNHIPFGFRHLRVTLPSGASCVGSSAQVLLSRHQEDIERVLDHRHICTQILSERNSCNSMLRSQFPEGQGTLNLKINSRVYFELNETQRVENNENVLLTNYNYLFYKISRIS